MRYLFAILLALCFSGCTYDKLGVSADLSFGGLIGYVADVNIGFNFGATRNKEICTHEKNCAAHLPRGSL